MKISWLKLDVDILDDQKIKLIRKNPLGDQIFVLWIGMLCMAMKSHRKGFIDIAEAVFASEDDIAKMTDLPVEVVKIGLKTFERLKMVTVTDDGIEINKFSEKQNLESIEYQRERNRLKQAKHREKARKTIEKITYQRTQVSNRLLPMSKSEREIETKKDINKELETKSKNDPLPNASSEEEKIEEGKEPPQESIAPPPPRQGPYELAQFFLETSKIKTGFKPITFREGEAMKFFKETIESGYSFEMNKAAIERFFKDKKRTEFFFRWFKSDFDKYATPMKAKSMAPQYAI